jgi:hypothetical protein
VLVLVTSRSIEHEHEHEGMRYTSGMPAAPPELTDLQQRLAALRGSL